jgi:uncharacterized membrane protein
MDHPLSVKHYPLSKAARIAIAIALIFNVLALLSVAYYYPGLPDIVATHVGLNGVPNSYGYKSTLLTIPVIFLAIFLLLLLVMRFRYTLLEKYPYLINLPSFVYRLGMEKDSKMQGEIIGKVFTVYSLVILYVSTLDFAITAALLRQSQGILPPVILTTVFVFVATILLLYRSIYRSFAAKR